MPESRLEIALLSIQGFVTVLLLLFLFIYWSKCEKSSLRYYFVVFQILIIIFALSHILIHINTVIGIQDIYPRFIKNISFLYAEFTFFLLCLFYTQPKRPNNKRLLYIYFVPTIYTIVSVTSVWHGLMGNIYFITYSNGFVDCELTKSNFCVVVDTVIIILLSAYFTPMLIRKLFKLRGRIFKQCVLLVIIGGIPGLLYGYDKIVKGILPFDFDIVPLTLIMVLLLFNIFIFYYRLFDLQPIAFNEIVENIKEAVIILDEDNNIIYTNPFFKKVFSPFFKLEYHQNVNNFFDKLNSFSENEEDIELFKSIIHSSNETLENIELSLKLANTTTFIVKVQPITALINKIQGKIISFNDVTSYKKLLNDLVISNKKLKEYSSTIEDLAITDERNRIARDVHDSISYEITTIINMLDICILDFKNEKKIEAMENLMLSSASARKCLAELRNSIFCLTHTGFESCEKSIKLIKSLISTYGRLGVNTDFSVIGDFYVDNSKIWEAIFHVCQEGMTNAVRHGKAENITIIIKLDDKKNINVYIIDDGKGCININKGIGLKSMESRVESINGSIIYGSGDDGGFNINITIPIQGV